MNSLHLSNLCPEIFQNRTDLQSEIWKQDVLLEKGKIYLIEAMSGTGKSSLCSYLSGYRNDYTGTLSFDHEDTKHLSVSQWSEIRKMHISHLYQDLRLFPELTAFENVEIKNKLTHHTSEKQIDEWLDFLGIIDKRDTLVGRMSFGQQQRVAMIRALVQPFDFLLADEPVSHLDDHHARLMAQLMTEEVKARQAGAIVTSIGKRMPVNYDRILKL